MGGTYLQRNCENPYSPPILGMSRLSRVRWRVAPVQGSMGVIPSSWLKEVSYLSFAHER